MISLNCCGLLLTDGDQFCSSCGRRSGRLADLAPQVINLSPSETEWNLPLRNLGPGTLPYRIEVSTPHIEVVGMPSGEILGGNNQSIRLRLGPDAPPQVTAVATIWTRDAARRSWWIKDEEREVRVPVTVSRQLAATLYVPTLTLFFADAAPSQCLYLFNQGDETAAVTIQAPSSFRLSRTLDLQGERVLSLSIEGRSDAAVWVMRIAPIGPEQSLEVVCGTQQFSVNLLPLLPPSRAVFKPDYVVGIDFGTSNTSLRLRKVADPNATPIAIGEDRFPSALFIDLAHPKSALIGQAAIDAYNPAGNNETFLVSGIKTLIRLDMEPYINHGPLWSVANLLRLYLTELRRMIHEYLDKEGVKDENNILYVFTLPVLDAGGEGVKYARQEDRMRRAAEQAGFPDDPDLVWTITEPRAAAQQIAHVLPTYAGMAGFPSGIGPDTRLCVVDAGGGTTDVCIGDLKIDDTGCWKFIERKGGALTKSPGSAVDMFQALRYPDPTDYSKGRVRPDDSEIGGNAIDMEIGYRSLPNGSDQPHFLPQAWNSMYQDLMEIALLPIRVERFLEGIRKLKEELSDFEHHAIDLSEEDEGLPELYKYFGSREEEAMAGCDPIFDYSKDVAPVIEAQWKDPNVGAHLQQLLTEAGGCDFVIPIGGTTLTPAYLRELRKWTGLETVETPKKERMTAIVNGAVWTYDARMERMLPTALTLLVQIGTEAKKKKVLSAFQPLSACSTFSQRYIPAEETLRLTLMTEQGGREIEIARSEMRSPASGDIRVQTSVSEGRTFRLSVSPTGGASQILWEVTL